VEFDKQQVLQAAYDAVKSSLLLTFANNPSITSSDAKTFARLELSRLIASKTAIHQLSDMAVASVERSLKQATHAAHDHTYH
jgi:hypothetical protein